VLIEKSNGESDDRSKLESREKQRDVEQEQQCESRCQQLVKPFPTRDRGHDRCKGEDHVKFPIQSTRQVSLESEFFRCTEDDASQHETEEPASMREVVVSQIDYGVPGRISPN
jgi:hypothetical protein